MSKKSSGQPDTTRRRKSFFSVSGWPLRRKVALALAIPMILAAVFGGLRVSDSVRDQRDYEATQEQLTVLHPLVDYFDAVEVAAVVTHSTRQDDPRRAESVAAVVAASEKLSAAQEKADLPGEQGRTLDRTIGATSSLLEEGGYADLGSVVTQLRMLYAGVQEFAELVVSDQLVPDPQLPQLTFAVGGRLAFTVQQIQVDKFGGGLRNPYDVYGDIGMEQAAIDQLFRIRGPEEVLIGLSKANDMRLEQITAGELDLPYEETFALYDQLTDSVLEGTESNLATWSADAERDAMLSAGVTAGALLLATLLALFVSRLLVRPVQRVRDGALTVASETLPQTVARIRAGEDPGEIEPIDVTTDEEIGQLARAVDDMHRTAVRLAAGEARIKSQVGEMFVTLSRRNTSLVNQQLSLIENLERDEDDPERLQSLFRLDHLASRMRRTAESLVILSDAPVRQREQAPLSVSDVIQAAAGGVQQYERVHVMGFPTEQITGSAASDLVHLLTELIDNALSFSPPSTPVEVTTTTSMAETVIRVSDSGLGMPDLQQDNLNEMLRSGGEVTPDTARRMGLFVVSRLAHRHGINVRLATNSRGGVIASVSLPPALLAAPPTQIVPDRPVVRAVPDAPDSRSAGSTNDSGPQAPELDPIMAAINAVTGLPQRRPGSTRQDRLDSVGAAGGMFDRSEASAPAASEPRPAATPVPPRPLVSAGSAAPEAPTDQDGPSYRVPLVPRRSVQLPEPEVTELDARRQEPATAVVTPLPVPTNPFEASQHGPAQAGPELPRRQPLNVTTDVDGLGSGTDAPVSSGTTTISVDARSAGTSAPVADPLHDPFDTIDHGQAPSEPGESPIFASLQSSWLGHGDNWGPEDADAGWRAAEAAEEHVTERTRSGLPQRRPGNRLVPGAAGAAAVPASAPLSRDPEAIRARLAAHAAGVNRGRSTSTPPTHEEAGPA